VGYAAVVDMARRAGLNNNIRPTPAVALGAYVCTPLEMAGAYTVFANGGTFVKPSMVAQVRSPDGRVLYRHVPEAHPALDADKRSEQVRWMLSAMGQKRHSTEEELYVKFDCWSIPELPVVRRAFPTVPWIFLYRDPVEVLVSQLQIRALWSLPGGLPTEVLGVQANDSPLDEYCARMLGRICEIALEQFRRTPGGLLVNYAEMPAFCTSGMLRHFQMEVGAEEVERMRQASAANSKNPTLPFEPDGDVKRHAATERMRELADRWIAPFYEELEIARRRQ